MILDDYIAGDTGVAARLYRSPKRVLAIGDSIPTAWVQWLPVMMDLPLRGISIGTTAQTPTPGGLTIQSLVSGLGAVTGITATTVTGFDTDGTPLTGTYSGLSQLALNATWIETQLTDGASIAQSSHWADKRILDIGFNSNSTPGSEASVAWGGQTLAGQNGTMARFIYWAHPTGPSEGQLTLRAMSPTGSPSLYTYTNHAIDCVADEPELRTLDVEMPAGTVATNVSGPRLAVTTSHTGGFTGGGEVFIFEGVRFWNPNVDGWEFTTWAHGGWWVSDFLGDGANNRPVYLTDERYEAMWNAYGPFDTLIVQVGANGLGTSLTPAQTAAKIQATIEKYRQWTPDLDVILVSYFKLPTKDDYVASPDESFITFPLPASGYTWTAATKRLARAGTFTSYTKGEKDYIYITGGTGVTAGWYPIASKVDANTIELAVSIAASDTATVTAGGIGLVWSGSDATTTEGEMAALADEMESLAESMDRVLYLNLRERAGSGPMVASRLLGSDRVHLTNPVGYATIAGHVAAMLREAAARADVAYTPSELIAAIAASNDINAQQQANVQAALTAQGLTTERVATLPTTGTVSTLTASDVWEAGTRTITGGTVQATLGGETVAEIAAALGSQANLNVYVPASGSNIDVYKGDAYSNDAGTGRRITVTKAASETHWPTTLSTVHFTCKPTARTLEDHPDATGLEDVACTVTTATGDGQAFYLELTDEQTATLTAGVGAYEFWFVANVSTAPATLRSGSMTARRGASG